MYFKQGWASVAVSAHNEGFLTRLWVLNDEKAWKDAQAARVNLLVTNKIRKHEWASFGEKHFHISPD